MVPTASMMMTASSCRSMLTMKSFFFLPARSKSLHPCATRAGKQRHPSRSSQQTGAHCTCVRTLPQGRLSLACQITRMRCPRKSWPRWPGLQLQVAADKVSVQNKCFKKEHSSISRWQLPFAPDAPALWVMPIPAAPWSPMACIVPSPRSVHTAHLFVSAPPPPQRLTPRSDPAIGHECMISKASAHTQLTTWVLQPCTPAHMFMIASVDPSRLPSA